MTFVSTVFCCVACKVHLSCAPNRIVNAAKIATRVRRINVDVHGSDEWASAPVRSASGHGAVAHPALVAAVGLKFQNVPQYQGRIWPKNRAGLLALKGKVGPRTPPLEAF